MADLPVRKDELDEILFNALEAIFNFERSKIERFELSYDEIYLLQFLRRKSPLRMSEIASRMKIPVSTATRLVGRLEKMRLLNREKGGDDRRVVFVSLHKNGEHAVRAVEKHTFEIISKNLEGFGARDVESFVSTAKSLSAILKTQ